MKRFLILFSLFFLLGHLFVSESKAATSTVIDTNLGSVNQDYSFAFTVSPTSTIYASQYQLFAQVAFVGDQDNPIVRIWNYLTDHDEIGWFSANTQLDGCTLHNVSSTASWVSCDLSGAQLVAGQKYWISVGVPSSTLSYKYASYGDPTGNVSNFRRFEPGQTTSTSGVFGTMKLYGSDSPLSFSLGYPTQGVSTPDFNNWVFHRGSGTFVGKIGVRYGQTSSTMILSDEMDFSSLVFSPTLVDIPIPKTTLLNPTVNLTATSTWYAQPYIRTGSSTTYGQMVSFVVDPNAVISTYTSAGILAGLYTPIQPFTGSSSSLQECGITNIGGCFVNAGVYLGNFFFRPSTLSQTYISSKVDGFKSVFPFKILFSVVSSTQTAVDFAESSGTQSLAISNLPNFPGMTIPILNADLFLGVMSSSTRATVFDIQEAVLWIGSMGIIMLTVL